MLRPPRRVLRVPRPPSSSSYSTASSSQRTAWSHALARAATTTAVLVAIPLAYTYAQDTRARLHKHISTPLLRSLDPETAHAAAISACANAVSPVDPHTDPSQLKASIWGRELSNPFGMAAGFDKHASAVPGVLSLGFGFVEIGSVTPRPQPGNPQPRMFRLPDAEALVNRYGFNSHGHRAVRENLLLHRFNLHGSDAAGERVLAAENQMLGVNLGKNKASAATSPQDFILGVRRLGPYADYLVINVSSPNTPGLRGMQHGEVLEDLVRQVMRARDALSMDSGRERPRVVLKVSPDLVDEDVQAIARVVRRFRVDGICVANTTTTRPEAVHGDMYWSESGGLSGAPLFSITLPLVRRFYSLLNTGKTDPKVPIIACGGVRSADDALAYARAGASLVQMFSGMVYGGAGLVGEIKDEVGRRLASEGKVWADIIGEEHHQG